MARTVRVVAAAIVAALLLPASSGAGSACRVAVDARDDVTAERESVRATQAAGAYAGVSPGRARPPASPPAATTQSADVARGSRPVEDDSIDLLALDARVEGADLLVTIEVEDLMASPGNRALEYTAMWHADDSYWALTAHRGRDGGWSFSRGTAPRDVALALQSVGRPPAIQRPGWGHVELAAGLVTMGMPVNELPGGVSWLEGMYAQAREERTPEARASASTPVASEANVDWTDDGRFPLSGPCPKPPTCPVATDPAGDAGVSRGATDQPQTATPALDLLAVGGTGDRDTIIVSARVVDASTAAPHGFDVIGWTISWRANGGGRWIAQAQRSVSGVDYSLAFDAAGTRDAVSGPVFGGTATTGAIDTVNDLVSIAVPRSAIDSPGNGARLHNFGASSWAATSGAVGAAGYAVFDTTEMGVYFAGISCSA